ncbi:WDR89 [Blepharisma stoltei]|uniref:Uncharacterized protein n=1 Tax=Blepharisma stoltei TaxID=1481888 RepID=A0AAU9IJC5_9CILI|nr:unnamed protein product [Blepharisma stoltei]
MALTLQGFIKPASGEDYCVDLRLNFGLLAAGFSHSNTIHIFNASGLNTLQVLHANTTQTLSEISLIDENTITWCDRAGAIGIIDIRNSTEVHKIQTRDEWFCIDSSGYNLASGSNQGMKVWDIRNFQLKKHYQDIHADKSDVSSIKLSPYYSNIMVTCSDDSLMSIINIEAEEDDDYTLLNLEEPGLKVGFVDNNVYCVTMSRYVEYNPHADNNEIPPEVVQKLPISDFQMDNPNPNFFIGPAGFGPDKSILIGSHEGGLWASSIRNPKICYPGVGHTQAVRAAATLYDGTIVTGSEDSSIISWRIDRNATVAEAEVESKSSSSTNDKRPSREERYYRPY